MIIGFGFLWVAIAAVLGFMDIKKEEPLSAGYWASLVIANLWFASAII